MIYPENAEVHILEDEDASRAYLLQVWAEAMTIYRSGKYSMKFSKSIQRQLVEVQKDFMPEDTEAGQIQGFLEHYTAAWSAPNSCFKEALGHTYDEPKRWQLHNINEIMNTVVTGLEVVLQSEDVRRIRQAEGLGTGTFRQRTARQRRWICGTERGRMPPVGTSEGVDRLRMVFLLPGSGCRSGCWVRCRGFSGLDTEKACIIRRFLISISISDESYETFSRKFTK